MQVSPRARCRYGEVLRCSPAPLRDELFPPRGWVAGLRRGGLGWTWSFLPAARAGRSLRLASAPLRLLAGAHGKRLGSGWVLGEGEGCFRTSHPA